MVFVLFSFPVEGTSLPGVFRTAATEMLIHRNWYMMGLFEHVDTLEIDG